MPNDHYGNAIGVGDTVEFVVGIPGRTVHATVFEKVDRRHGSRLFVSDGTAEMALRFVLDFFDCRIVQRKEMAADGN